MRLWGNKCHGTTTTMSWRVMLDPRVGGGAAGLAEQECPAAAGEPLALCLEIINPGFPDKTVVTVAPRDQGAVVAAGARGDVPGFRGRLPAGCCMGMVLAEPLGACAHVRTARCCALRTRLSVALLLKICP